MNREERIIDAINRITALLDEPDKGKRELEAGLIVCGLLEADGYVSVSKLYKELLK